MSGTPHIGRAEPPPEPVAWRCEQCRKFISKRAKSNVVYVEEISQRMGQRVGYATRGRFTRRMVVCTPCRRTISDVEGE